MPTRAAFNQGQKPTICLINKAKLSLGTSLPAMCAALQKYVDDHFAPVWGTPCRLTTATKPLRNAWALIFLDNPDVADAFGYHDLTSDGLPLLKVFVKVCQDNGEAVSVTASHELAEALVDPAVNIWCDGPKGTMWAYETADAVEETTFDVAGLPMSNFVYPAFFEGFRKAGSVKFDHLGLVKRPFQLLKGGYSTTSKNGQVSDIFGSRAKARRFSQEDRRGHRSEGRGQSKRRAV